MKKEACRFGTRLFFVPDVFLYQSRAECLAGRLRLVVRRLVGDDAVAGESQARILRVGFPCAHPFAVTPAVGAEESDLLAGESAFCGFPGRCLQPAA